MFLAVASFSPSTGAFLVLAEFGELTGPTLTHSTDFRQFQEYRNLTGLDVSLLFVSHPRFLTHLP